MLLGKVVISRKKRSSPFSLSPVILLAINMNRFMKLECREICLAFLLCQQPKKFGKHCFRQYSEATKQVNSHKKQTVKESQSGKKMFKRS